MTISPIRHSLASAEADPSTLARLQRAVDLLTEAEQAVQSLADGLAGPALRLHAVRQARAGDGLLDAVGLFADAVERRARTILAESERVVRRMSR